MLTATLRRRLGVIAVFVAALTSADVALATELFPGFDLLHTPSGQATLDIPGVGLVSLQSRKLIPPNPIHPPTPIAPGLGNADTIVERTGGLPPGGTGIIPVELVALSLVSVAPVDVGGTLYDVFVINDPGAFSTGQMTIQSNISGVGTFDSSIDVFVDVTLAESLNPLNQLAPLNLQLLWESTGTGWSHIPPPLHPPNPIFPSGDFFADEPWVVSFSGDATGSGSFVPAAIPSPATAWMLLALLGPLGMRRRTMRTA